MRPSESETDSDVRQAGRSRGAATTATAVLLVAALGTAAGLALSTADRSMLTSLSYKHETESLMLAESAVEYTMAYLDTVEDWSTLQLPSYNAVPQTIVGRGIIWADIKNDVYDRGGAMDTNDMVLIKGHGQLLNSTKVANVESLYWRPSFTIPPIASVNMCGEDVLAANNGNMRVSGFNHYLPPSPCSGSHCNEVRKYEEPDVAGISFEIAGQEIYASLPRTVEGEPPLASGVCHLQGPTGLCARAKMLIANLNRVVGVEVLTDWPIHGKGSYGSVADPKIILVPDDAELRLNGTSQGAGILFVKGSLFITGTFTWTGIIIVGPDAEIDQRGTANIFGSVITAGSPDNPAALYMKGNGSIVWAADAINIGPFNLPALMSSWREFR